MRENKRLKYIGAKDLASLAKKDFCPRCFWYERYFGPFPSIFPGIFNVIDKNLKNSVWLRWRIERKIPSWLKIDNLKEILSIDKIGKVEVSSQGQKYLIAQHQKSGFFLKGIPDLVLGLRDDTLHIIDFKLARFKEGGDYFFPVYEAQLNCYAILATKIPVSKLSLVYFNPSKEIPSGVLTEDNFKMAFEPKVVPVEIKPRLISQLLMTAKEILNSKNPPLARENCQGPCFYIDKISSASQFQSK